MAKGGQRRGRRVLSAGLSVAVVVGVFWYFLPQYTDVSKVWTYVRTMSWQSEFAIAVAATWNLCTYWFVNMSTMPGLRLRQAAVVTESATAVSNTLPGGGAIGIGLSYAMYSSWGFSKSRSTVSLTVSGIWNNFAKLGTPVLALAILALSSRPGSGRIIAGVIGIVALGTSFFVFAMLLRSEEWANRLGEAMGRVASRVLRLFH